tara:strand:- start:136 stop:531 length:396 start_codon:yes stop_codon:yes gene_type:complete
MSISTCLTACTDNIIGDWDGSQLTSVSDSSASYALPFEECASYNGSEQCYTADFHISIQDDLTGSMDMKLAMYDFDIDLTIEKKGTNTYDLVGTIPFMDDSLTFTCTLEDADNLQCTESLELEAIIDFVRE